VSSFENPYGLYIGVIVIYLNDFSKTL